MAASGSPGTEAGTPPAASAAARARERAFRIVLLGLVVLAVGSTAVLVANAFYPCEPAAGSVVQPPLADCAVSLSPWIGVALVGLVLAIAGYLRVG